MTCKNHTTYNPSKQNHVRKKKVTQRQYIQKWAPFFLMKVRSLKICSGVCCSSKKKKVSLLVINLHKGLFIWPQEVLTIHNLHNNYITIICRLSIFSLHFAKWKFQWKPTKRLERTINHSRTCCTRPVLSLIGTQGHLVITPQCGLNGLWGEDKRRNGHRGTNN